MNEIGDQRLRLLLNGLDAPWEMLDARLTGRRPFQGGDTIPETDMTDDEYFWEPVPGCWSVRRRGSEVTSMAFGAGDWLLDRERPEPQPPPITTIAWRICHLVVSLLMRHDYTFGTHQMKHEDISWPGTARDGVELLRSSFTQWRTGLQGVSPENLSTVGYSQMPYGRDPNERFDDLVAWENVEFAHHAAEIGLLRDLYRARFS
jgi:DinB superfamily